MALKYVGVAFYDGPRCRERRRYVMKTLSDLPETSTSMEMRILAETDDLIGQLDTAKGGKVSVHNLFNRSVINSLLSVLISKKFEAHDPQLDQLVEALTRYVNTQNNSWFVVAHLAHALMLL